MRIIPATTASPLQVAKAYGLNPPRPAELKLAQPAGSTAAPFEKLVGGTVQGPVNFDSPQAITAARAAHETTVLPMYTRAADRVEAAVAVQLGRTIDLKG